MTRSTASISVLIALCSLGLISPIFGQDETSPSFTWPPWPSAWPTIPTFTTPDYTPFPSLPPVSDAIVAAGELGKIQGSYSYLSRPLYGNRDYFYWFTGIPYAKPESYMGENRFKPAEVHTGPLEPTNEDGVFNGLRPFIWCPQAKLIDIDIPTSADNFTEILGAAAKTKQRRKDGGIGPEGDGYMGQEDCLIATVSTPKIQREGEPDIPSAELLPVIVFIHGGGFNQFWGSVFGGHRLLNRDVVVVSLNYRLGILGSLNFDLDDAPGNALVYDCLTALEWVQKYIHHFGGDKSRVTISGQSAGAVLSTAVFLSPMSEGLISGAIGASGSAYSIWATNLTPRDDHLRYATFTPCNYIIEEAPSQDEVDLQLLTDCIKGLTLGELVKSQEDYSSAENLQGRMGYDALVPSIQSPSITHDRCIVESPKDVVKNKRQADVPLMMGVTRHDGSFVFDTTYNSYLVPNELENNQTFIKNDFLPTFLRGVGFEDKTGALLHSLQHTYVGDAFQTNDFEKQIPGILDIHTVVGFKAGAFGLVEEHSKLNPNSYYYAFDYKGMFSTYPFAAYAGTPVPGGVAHVDDLIYLFQLFPLFSESDVEVTKRCVDYWVNFATYGNPNGEGNEPFPRYTATDHKFLIINGTDSVGVHCRDTWVDNSLELMK